MSAELAANKDVLELEVRRSQERVGSLRRTDTGARFQYDSAYANAHRGDAGRAIASRMPVRDEPFDVRGTNLHPFFAGLLPEGLRLGALVRGLKTSEDDLFSLLAAAGGDTVGDVWVLPVGAQAQRALPLVEARDLGQHSFEELLAASLDWGRRGDPVTVSGVQPKISAAMISLPLRAGARRRESILKLSPEGFPRLVENEAYFMQLARSMRLPTAATQLVVDSRGVTGLLVERFDRETRAGQGQAEPRRLHQEDACQLLDRYPAEKYRLALREIADALEVCSAPMVERLRLVQLEALSYLIGNGDLHGKNISVQVTGGRVRLTPIYDLLSTLPYGDAKLALKIEGRDEKLRRADFLAFGERIGLRRAAIESMLAALVRGVGARVESLEQIGLGERRTRQLQEVMRERLVALGA